MATAEAAAPTAVARSEQSVFERVDDVKDPRQEWRRLFSEVLGTFFLVLVAAGNSNPSKKVRITPVHAICVMSPARPRVMMPRAASDPEVVP